jgi:hypothetical protein
VLKWHPVKYLRAGFKPMVIYVPCDHFMRFVRAGFLVATTWSRGSNIYDQTLKWRAVSNSWHGFKTVSTFSPSPRFYATICPKARRLGAGGALTILQFGPFFGTARCQVLTRVLERVLGSCTQRCVL